MISLTEKLQLNKQSKVINLDINKLVDDILEHLLIQIYDKGVFVKQCKPIIKNWIIDNDVNEVEYWMNTNTYNYVATDPMSKSYTVKMSDYKYVENLDHIIGTVEERRKDKEYELTKFSNLYTSKKYVCFTRSQAIYCVKKS